jgi:hypothetical protein
MREELRITAQAVIEAASLVVLERSAAHAAVFKSIIGDLQHDDTFKGGDDAR